MIPGVGQLRGQQGNFHNFQVHQYQLLRGSLYAHNMKCVIGKESRPHSGFVIQSTMSPSPDPSKYTSSFLSKVLSPLGSYLCQFGNVKGSSKWK